MADQLMGWLWVVVAVLAPLTAILGAVLMQLRCVLAIVRVVAELRQAWPAAFGRSRGRLPKCQAKRVTGQRRAARSRSRNQS
jgi:hypothetical protein